MNFQGSMLKKVTRYNDIVLAVVLVAIISLMILPLPTPMVDGLIACNLSAAIILLMLSTYIPSALALSSFPTLLLFTTLFRLALNITTTRQILLNGYAGKIIDTFGNLVVAGNFVVGAVVFLIITIVQFLVIAKGSERVAEVGARFTLDAMPGKQMSIDADMRAGVIDMNEARERRSNVERVSQLYGAMDGAMKFVKGDAIAGLVIIVINVLGGITIGCLQKGMEIGDAVQTYSILTIGDGLISQIPALFISITAGIIVTRVDSDASSGLGNEIGEQVLAQPKALLVAGVIIFAFALVPGFPALQFLLFGLAAMGIGYSLHKPSRKKEDPRDRLAASMAPAGQKNAPAGKDEVSDDDSFSVTVPLLLDVSPTVHQAVEPEVFDRELIKLRRALYLDLGVPFPGIHLRINGQLPENFYTILLHEVPMSGGEILPGYCLTGEREEHLSMMGVKFEKRKDFLPNLPSLWVDASLAPKLEKAGIATMDPARILTFHLSCILKKHAEDFIGLQETKMLMENMEAQFGELVREVQRTVPLQKITDIFQRLVQEDISIRNLRAILESLVEWGQKEKDVILLTEYVRMELKRYICYKYSGGQNLLAAYMLDGDVEEMVRKAIRQTSGGSYLALDPQQSATLVKRMKQEIGDIGLNMQKPVLLVSMDIRRYMKKLIETELELLPVLSYQELTPEITIQPLARISM